MLKRCAIVTIVMLPRLLLLKLRQKAQAGYWNLLPFPVVHTQLIKGEHVTCILFLTFLKLSMLSYESWKKFARQDSGFWIRALEDIHPTSQSGNQSVPDEIQKHNPVLLSIHWGFAPESPGICHGQPWVPAWSTMIF